MLYLVKDLSQYVTDDPGAIAAFESFFDASDFVGEHPDEHLVIEMWDEFVPVITDADIDEYFNDPECPGGVDPRSSWDELDLPYVLQTLGYVGEMKSLNLHQPDPGQVGYEIMLYQYSETARVILS